MVFQTKIEENKTIFVSKNHKKYNRWELMNDNIDSVDNENYETSYGNHPESYRKPYNFDLKHKSKILIQLI